MFNNLRISPNKPFIKYLIVGSLAFITDYLILMLCYFMLGINLILSTTLGYFTGFLISFTANRSWVFAHQSKNKKIHKQIVEYSMLVIFNYVFTVIFIKSLDQINITPKISKIIVMTLIVIWNYLLFKYVIFKSKI